MIEVDAAFEELYLNGPTQEEVDAAFELQTVEQTLIDNLLLEVQEGVQ